MDAPALRARYEPHQTLQVKAPRQVCAARYSPCGKYLVAAGHDGLVRRWDATTDGFRELSTLEGHPAWVQEIAFSAPAGLMFTVDGWGGLRAWVYDSGSPELRWSLPQAHDAWIRGVAVSPDGALVATCAVDRRVRVWSAADGGLKHDLAAHEWAVLAVAFHPSGGALVSGDLRGVVRHWDLASNGCVRTLDAAALYAEHRLQECGGARVLAFHADGSLLAVAGTRPGGGGTIVGPPTVLVYDWASGELRHTLELGTANDVYVCDLRFHPDGFLMAVTSGQPGAGKLVFRRLEDDGPFYETTSMLNCHSLTLHPSGRRLVVAATNGGSNGNGRLLDANGEYPDNFSPLHVLDLP